MYMQHPVFYLKSVISVLAPFIINWKASLCSIYHYAYIACYELKRVAQQTQCTLQIREKAIKMVPVYPLEYLSLIKKKSFILNDFFQVEERTLRVELNTEPLCLWDFSISSLYKTSPHSVPFPPQIYTLWGLFKKLTVLEM